MFRAIIATTWKHRKNFGIFMGGFASHWAVGAQATKIERCWNERQFPWMRTRGKGRGAEDSALTSPANTKTLWERWI
ncbi:hypothetical protein B9Z19DRAFT_1122565 [Tuber borchii]|uniref:Uncharacterized protein n=1 Tax=Tuber borchii TaxID=42251 RepID=A0A2T6ZZY4_TUBBO|nr:hypothetical protein B9Z19DRAFT_1122565 [Tuber borchii]